MAGNDVKSQSLLIVFHVPNRISAQGSKEHLAYNRYHCFIVLKLPIPILGIEIGNR